MPVLGLNTELYNEFTTVLNNQAVSPQVKYFPVWEWLSAHGVDPRECVNKETRVVLVKEALPAVQFKKGL